MSRAVCIATVAFLCAESVAETVPHPTKRAGIAQAQAPHGAVVGWGQVVGEDAAQGFTARGTGAGVITLDPNGECSLNIGGSVNLDLTSAPGYSGDTAIQVNSDNSYALCVNGSHATCG